MLSMSSLLGFHSVPQVTERFFKTLSLLILLQAIFYARDSLLATESINVYFTLRKIARILV